MENCFASVEAYFFFDNKGFMSAVKKDQNGVCEFVVRNIKRVSTPDIQIIAPELKLRLFSGILDVPER
jgi:hypothetical protein